MNLKKKKKQLKRFSYTYQPLPFCKNKKKFYSGSRVIRMHHFLVQNSPFAPSKTFFWKMILKSF